MRNNDEYIYLFNEKTNIFLLVQIIDESFSSLYTLPVTWSPFVTPTPNPNVSNVKILSDSCTPLKKLKFNDEDKENIHPSRNDTRKNYLRQKQNNNFRILCDNSNILQSVNSNCYQKQEFTKNNEISNENFIQKQVFDQTTILNNFFSNVGVENKITDIEYECNNVPSCLEIDYQNSVAIESSKINVEEDGRDFNGFNINNSNKCNIIHNYNACMRSFKEMPTDKLENIPCTASTVIPDFNFSSVSHFKLTDIVQKHLISTDAVLFVYLFTLFIIISLIKDNKINFVLLKNFYLICGFIKV